MSRRRRNVTSRDGLFEWVDTAAGDVAPAEVRPNPLLDTCRYCGAGIGQRCTRPSRHGRVERSPHDTRIEDATRAAQADQEPTVPPPSAATSEPKGRS